MDAEDQIKAAAESDDPGEAEPPIPAEFRSTIAPLVPLHRDYDTLAGSG